LKREYRLKRLSRLEALIQGWTVVIEVFAVGMTLPVENCDTVGPASAARNLGVDPAGVHRSRQAAARTEIQNADASHDHIGWRTSAGQRDGDRAGRSGERVRAESTWIDDAGEDVVQRSDDDGRGSCGSSGRCIRQQAPSTPVKSPAVPPHECATRTTNQRHDQVVDVGNLGAVHARSA
jgi:hypothetical protein